MKKYSKFLTLLLVILTISLIVLVVYAIYTLYDDYMADQSAEDLMAQFENNYEPTSNEEEPIDGEIEGLPEDDNNNTTTTPAPQGTTSSGGGSSSYGLGTYYKGYKVIGLISIPKLNIQYPIFANDTTETLKVGTAAIYPANAEVALNNPGNVVIAGHNYRNSRMFSKLYKLNSGDSIYITNIYGAKLEYKVYNNYTTGSMDFDYATRETNDNIEISLTTCTTDASTRTIVWARVQ